MRENLPEKVHSFSRPLFKGLTLPRTSWRALSAFITLFALFISSHADAQCINTSSYGSGTVGATNLTPVTLSTCNWPSEYATVTVNDAGNYVFASSVSTDYITITDGSNTVVSHGLTPHTASISASGTYRMHITLDASCTTGNGCRASTVVYSPCVSTTSYLSGSIGSTNTSPVTFGTCWYAGEYVPLTISAAGAYEFSSSIATDVLTLTDASNVPIATGAAPLSVNVLTSGSYRLHVFSDVTCGTASVCRALSGKALVPLCGTYTIDGSQATSGTNFQTFGEFASTAGTLGVSCAVTVNVKQGTYTEQVNIGAIPGVNASNKLTIQADPTNTSPVILTYAPTTSSDNYTVNISGANDIKFDGITFESTGTSYSRIIQLGGTCANIEFDGNTFTAPTSTTSTTFKATFYYSSLSIDGLIITNNTFNNNAHIMYLVGSSSAPSDSLVFENNTCNGFYGYGIYLGYFNRLWVRNNDFVSSASSSSQYGIYSYTSSSVPNSVSMIEGNDIQLNTTSTFYGIYANYLVSSMTAPSQWVNNMISNAATTGTGTRYGIYPYACSYINIYHNSLSIQDGSATSGRALYLNTTGTSYGNIDIRNNIISNTGNGYAVEVSSAAASGSYVSTMNYNLYNFTSSNTSPLRYNNSNSSDLAAWQLATSFDANSVAGDPIFMNASDLHVIGTAANDVGDNTVGVLTDIDGDTRPASGSTIVDIGADEYSPASCTPPSGLTAYNVTSTSAMLAWTTGGASNWMIQYDTAGFTPGTGNFVAAANDTLMLSGLMPQTSYDVYVKDSCSATSVSPWFGPVTFTTACTPFIAPITENFDGLPLVSPYTDLPACWEPQVGPDFWDVTDDLINTGHTYLPNIGDHTTGSGNYMWIDASADITGNAMITGLVDVSGLTTPFAGFWFASNNTTNTVNHTISLDAWDGTAWVNIATESGNFASWVEVSGAVPATVPNITKFRIMAIADPTGTSSTYFYNDLGVDDFFVMEMPTCPAPTSLMAMVSSTSTAMASWSSSASTFQVQYDTTGFSIGSGSVMTVNNDTTVNLTGLMANTNYELYVRAICAPGDTSTWTGPVSFYTGHCIPNPSSVDGIGITNVTMGTINNTTVAEPGNYGDYSSLSTDVVGGDSLAIDVTYQTGYTYDTWVWVDWNDDLDFFDAGEAYYLGNSASANPTTLSGSIAIPAGVALGNHRIRIGGADAGLGSTPPSNPCYTGSWASFEDYTLNVVPCAASNQCLFSANLVDDFGDGWNGGIVSFWINGSEIGTVGSNFIGGSSALDSISLCDGDSVIVVLKNAGSYPVEIGFGILNPDGVNLFTHPFTSGLSSGDTLGVFYSQCAIPSCPITDVPTVASQTSCGPGPVTFTAMGNTNPNQGYFWMNSDSAIVGLDDTYTTSPITATTNYYLGIGAINDAVQKQHVGPLPSIATSGFGNFSNGQWFSAQDFFYLDSITVRSNGALAFQVRISEPGAAGAGAALILSDTIFVSGAGDHQVEVGLPVAPGNYFININFIAGFGTGQLFRATAGAVYPYSISGLVSIDSVNFAGPRYYYTYDWVVSEVCTSTLATATATLGAVPSTAFPYAVDFNTGLPCNWSTDNSGAEWMNVANYGGSSLNSTNFMFIDDDAPGSGVLTESSLITPEFNTQGYDTLFMSFDHYFRAIGTSIGYVEVFDGATWVAIDSFSSNTGNWGAPATQSYDITMYQNTNLQVRFRYDDGGTWGWYWAVDNFAMDGTPLACTNVVVDILTDTWGSETTWSIVDTATGISYASGGPYPDVLIANYVDTICLPEGIWYEFRINDSYGDGLFDGVNTGTYSVDILCSWGNNNVISGSGAFPFGGPSGTAPSWDSTVFEVTCIVTCPDPDSLMAVADCDEAILSWTSDASSTGSTIQWGPAGFTPGTGNIITNATSPYNLTGLSVGTSYDFWVVDSCVSGSASSYVGPYTFTTDTLPIAVISANQNASPHPDTVQYGFSALGSVNGNSYWWDFGDGSANDTNMFAIHNYGQNGSYTVTLVVTNDCGSDTATQTIIVSGIGIDEYGFGNISLYPNPNDGYFTLSGLLSFGDDAKIEVITMTGTVVYSEKIVANGSETFVIDLRGYAPGVYQVRVSSKAGVGTKPFVLRN